MNSTDLDSGPAEIEYEIIRQPSKGRIVYVNDTELPVRKFTQEDVTLERVLFVPSQLNLTGSETVRDAFYFGVTDGIQRPAFNLFQVRVRLFIFCRLRMCQCCGVWNF